MDYQLGNESEIGGLLRLEDSVFDSEKKKEEPSFSKL